MKKLVNGIPKTAGSPYSTALEIGKNFISFSGQLPDLDKNKEPVSPDLAVQTRQVLTRIKKLLNACDIPLAGKITFNNLFDVFILIKGEVTKDVYSLVNGIYEEFLKADSVEDAPDRVFYGVLSLPCNTLIEIKFKAVLQVPEFFGVPGSAPDGE